jgi:hypothetical protein
MNRKMKNWSMIILCLLLIIIKGSIIFAQEPVTIKIPDPKKFSADIEEFIIDKSYLPLETRPDCLLPGHSPRIYFYNNLIYVLYRPLEGLYIFNNEGKFVNSFQSYGQGPNEVVSMYSLSFYKDELFVLDWKGGKILVMDLNGKPLRTIATPSYPYDMIHNDKGQLLLYIRKEDFKGKPYDIIGYDEQKSEFYGYWPAGDYYKGRSFNISVFTNTPNGAVWAPSAGDTIFSIHDEVARPAYILDFGKLSLSEDQKKTFDRYGLQRSKKPWMALEEYFQQAGNVISFLYATEERHYMVFGDLTTNKFYGGSWDFPDLELGRIYLPMGTTNDSYLFIVDAVNIIEEAENNPERCSAELLEVARNLDPEDNPVIISWRVK